MARSRFPGTRGLHAPAISRRSRTDSRRKGKRACKFPCQQLLPRIVNVPMNGWNCSTRINAPRRAGTFFFKLQSLSRMAGFISILGFLAFAGAGCQTDTNTTTFSGQADVPRHVILASGDVVKLTFSAAANRLYATELLRCRGAAARKGRTERRRKEAGATADRKFGGSL